MKYAADGGIVSTVSITALKEALMLKLVMQLTEQEHAVKKRKTHSSVQFHSSNLQILS